jgi:RNA polymerase sigma-70 factor (ECF subfamily)
MFGPQRYRDLAPTGGTCRSGAVGLWPLPGRTPGADAVPRRTTEIERAWHELFATQYPRLAGWVRRLVDDDDTAHEIAAEAFTRMMSRWSLPDTPLAYLYRIATNLVYDHWRRTRRERQAIRLLASDDRGARDERPGDSHELRTMLEPLSEPQRTAVVLHYLGGFPIHEVAEMVGRPEGTVKSDLSLARTRLRRGWEANRA